MTILHYSGAFRDLNLILGKIIICLNTFEQNKLREQEEQFTLVLRKTIHILRAIFPFKLHQQLLR